MTPIAVSSFGEGSRPVSPSRWAGALLSCGGLRFARLAGISLVEGRPAALNVRVGSHRGVYMPALPEITFGTFIPPYPLHFLQIVRYLLLLGVLVMMLLPREQSATTMTLLLGALALVTVGDIYGNKYIHSAFTVYMLRISMVIIPILLTGMAPSEQSRTGGIFLAILGAPSLLIMFTLPWFDPVLQIQPQ
jgi:hypothetical protein